MTCHMLYTSNSTISNVNKLKQLWKGTVRVLVLYVYWIAPLLTTKWKSLQTSDTFTPKTIQDHLLSMSLIHSYMYMYTI